MKKNEKIRTPLGIISVFKNEIPERYHCAAEPEILRISETHIRIRTIDQAVSWGEEVYSPRLHQNCMNPENITLYPCLLYTSPSPRDRQKPRMPSSA